MLVGLVDDEESAISSGTVSWIFLAHHGLSNGSIKIGVALPGNQTVDSFDEACESPLAITRNAYTRLARQFWPKPFNHNSLRFCKADA